MSAWNCVCRIIIILLIFQERKEGVQGFRISAHQGSLCDLFSSVRKLRMVLWRNTLRSNPSNYFVIIGVGKQDKRPLRSTVRFDFKSRITVMISQAGQSRRPTLSLAGNRGGRLVILSNMTLFTIYSLLFTCSQPLPFFIRDILPLRRPSSFAQVRYPDFGNN